MKRTHGFALPLVLWCIGILAAALVTAAVFIDASLSAQALSTQATIARQLALSGITFAIAAKTEKFPATFMRTVKGEGEFTVERTSDSGRVNLNALLRRKDTEALARMLTALGGDPLKTPAAAAALKRRTWLIEDGSQEGFLPFESPAQLQGVPEFADAMAKSTKWREAITLWGNNPIDLNFADATLLTTIGGLTAQQASLLVKARLGQDGIAGTKDDLKFSSVEQAAALAGLPPEAVKLFATYFGTSTVLQRIEAAATVGRLKRHISVVIKPGEKTFTPIAWDES